MRFAGRKPIPWSSEFEGLRYGRDRAGTGQLRTFVRGVSFAPSGDWRKQKEIMQAPMPSSTISSAEPTPEDPGNETSRRALLAGQINGTSRYEEATGQGPLGGYGAALMVQKGEPFVLDRSEAYMGVMVDDLITRGVDEPYGCSPPGRNTPASAPGRTARPSAS